LQKQLKRKLKKTERYASQGGFNCVHFLAQTNCIQAIQKICEHRERCATPFSFDTKVVHSGRTPLHFALAQQRVGTSIFLIGHKICSVQETTKIRRSTALHMAVWELTNPTEIVPVVDAIFTQIGLLSDQQKRAYLNQGDLHRSTALHLAARKLNEKAIAVLLTNPLVNVNAVDHLGRNALHLVIAARIASGKPPQSFSVEQLLVQAGISINTKDKFQRCPIHYCFVENQPHLDYAVQSSTNNNNHDDDFSSSSSSSDYDDDDEVFDTDNQQSKQGGKQLSAKDKLIQEYAEFYSAEYCKIQDLDPIETISSLCAIDGILLDEPDVFGKAPLHYAALRGATISSLYLLQRGADIERADVDGNTPLGLCVLALHPGLAIILIQKKANVKVPVAGVSWSKSQTWQVSKFLELYPSVRSKLSTTTSSTMSDDDDNTGAPTTEKSVTTLRPLWQKHADKSVKHFHSSMFRHAVKNKWSGVSYLMLDAGFDYMKAISAALSVCEFQLVATLLSKTKDAVLHQVSSREQGARNLFHTLAIHKNGFIQNWEVELARAFVARSITFQLRDAYNRLPLHYALANGYVKLSKFLIQEAVKAGADQASVVNAKDINGEVPLSFYLREYRVADGFMDAQEDLINVCKEYTSMGADLSQVELITSRLDEFSEPLVGTSSSHYDSDELVIKADSPHAIRTPLLVHAIQQQADIKFVRYLVEQTNVDLNKPDADGVTPLMHAIQINNTKVVQLLLSSKRIKVNVNAQDARGRSPVHYVIQPKSFGSYENQTLLESLIKTHKAKHTLKDKSGKLPQDYAALQDSRVMYKALERLGCVRPQKTPLSSRMSSAITDWSAQDDDSDLVDVESDAHALIAQAKQAALTSSSTSLTSNKPKVDATSNLQDVGEVYEDSEHNVVYDVLLTKTDVLQGRYGVNNFYKMQIIEQKAKSLFILWNKWGRLGEVGQYQRTPYAQLADAVKEFERVFRQKTGNTFSIYNAGNFIKKPKKYAVVNTRESMHEKVAELLKPFDFDAISTKTKIVDEHMQEPLKIITNVAMYQQQLRASGVDTQFMPLSNLTEEVLIEAKRVLNTLSGLVRKIQKRSDPYGYRRSWKTGDDDSDDDETDAAANLNPDTVLQQYETVAKLSSQFYELIPHTNFSHQRMKPIDNGARLKEKMDMISNLLDYEIASRILLGAHFRSDTVHPLDYCYRALNIHLEWIPPHAVQSSAASSTTTSSQQQTTVGSSEYNLIERYMKNTGGAQYRIKNLFRLQRKGEPERIAVHKDLPNHFLLWHGSKAANFIGILSQGLRIAPPEAPTTGFAFGKGVYFSDQFGKCVGYSSGYKGERFLLLAEVALGNMNVVNKPTYMEKPPAGTHSTKGQACIEPDFEKESIVLPNSVRVPMGELRPVKDPNNKLSLSYNEYVVYDESQVRLRYLIHVVNQ